jgi:hypothetical protein
MRMRLVLRAAPLTLVLGLAGCSNPLVGIGSALAEVAFAGGQAERGERGQLVAEVMEIDELQRRVRLTTDDGRTGTVLYDDNTLVLRQEQRLTIRALQPGDRVVVEVEQDSGRNLVALRFDIQPPEPDPNPDREPSEPERAPD